jgi:hypothetical protein
MNKIQLFAIAIGVTFLICMLPASPVAAAPAAKKKVAIEVGSISSTSAPDYKAFIQKLSDWGFDVVKLYNNNTQTSNMTYTSLTGCDILILPLMNTNLTTENELAVTTWWATGGKSLWVAGDSDYAGPGGYGAMAAHRPNRVLENIGSHIFLEQTAIESTWNDAVVGNIGYRVAAGAYASTGDAALLTQNLPTNKSVFHGPTCIIAKNSSGNYVDPLTGTGITSNVEWVAKAVNNTKFWSHSKNATVAVMPYRVHTYLQKGEYVLMALEKFGNGNKLIVTGEHIFSTYKNMFAIPTGEDTTKIGASMTLTYNTIMYFAGYSQDRIIPLAYNFDITIIDAFNGICLVEWRVFDEWAAQNASGVVGAILYVNDTQKLIAKRTDYVTPKMTAQISFPMNLTQAIIDNTEFAVIPMDFAGNKGYFLPASTIEYVPVTVTEVETSTITKSPGFEMPLALLAFAAIVVFVSRRKD